MFLTPSTENRGDFGHPTKNYSLFYILLPPTFSKNISYDILRQYINITNNYNLLV